MAGHISPINLRRDGRQLLQPREVLGKVGRFGCSPANGDLGAAVFEIGQTQVVAQVVELTTVPGRTRQAKQHSIICDISLFPAAMPERRARKNERTYTAYALAVQSALESVLALPKDARHWRIRLQLHVVGCDGGLLAALINAASLALVRAGVPLRDLVCAASVAWLEDKCVVDPIGTETTAASAELTLALLAREGSIVVMNCESRLPHEVLQQLVTYASESCRIIGESLKQIIDKHVEEVIIRSHVLSAKIQQYARPVAHPVLDVD